MGPFKRHRLKQVAYGLAAPMAVVAAITYVFTFPIRVNSTTAGFIYLLGVLWLAAASKLVQAIVASLLAMLCFNFFFLPPVGRFTIADPQNWVALLAFLATALVASHLSDRARRQASQAHARQQETEQLYALSRAILLSRPDGSLGRQVVTQIAQIYECPGVALYNSSTDEIYIGGAGEAEDYEAVLRRVAREGGTLHEPPLHTSAVALGGQPIGALAMRDRVLPDGAWQALLNLVAIGLERVRSEAAANRAEVARQSEEFKSTLLDAVAHEFKTPLTSIKAAASALLGSAAALPEALRELPAIIEEETDRLSVLVSQAARMAAIDAGTLQLERWPVHIDELCTRVVAQLAPYLEGREMRVEVPAGLPSVEADGDLIALALRQLLDNARKYAPPATPLELRAAPHRTSIVLTVRDHGETLAPRELERIFDRFYRREAVKRRVPGSGLGLHIAREIARAHGGELSAAAVADGGTIFTLELPLEGKA